MKGSLLTTNHDWSRYFLPFTPQGFLLPSVERLHSYLKMWNLWGYLKQRKNVPLIHSFIGCIQYDKSCFPLFRVPLIASFLLSFTISPYNYLSPLEALNHELNRCRNIPGDFLLVAGAWPLSERGRCPSPAWLRLGGGSVLVLQVWWPQEFMVGGGAPRMPDTVRIRCKLDANWTIF